MTHVFAYDYFSALFVYPILTRLGRKPGLMIAYVACERSKALLIRLHSGFLFLIGAVIQTASPGNLGMIYGGRVLTGLGMFRLSSRA